MIENYKIKATLKNRFYENYQRNELLPAPMEVWCNSSDSTSALLEIAISLGNNGVECKENA